MNIDWSKAPEGATHCDAEGQEFYRPASNYKGGEYFDPVAGEWFELYDFFSDLVAHGETVSFDQAVDQVMDDLSLSPPSRYIAKRVVMAGYRKQVTP